MTRTYDAVTLPGSKRTTHVLVAANGQTANRALLQLLSQQYIVDSSYTRTTSLFSGGVALPSGPGQSTPYTS